MHSFYDILVQAIGFLGLLFFFISFQVKTNKRFFVMQTLGCLTFSLQFALLGAFSGPLSLLVNITRNAMLTKYNESALVRWKGWIAVFSALSLAAALLTWSGPISLLPVATTVAGTIGYWTNNARNIRIAIHETVIRVPLDLPDNLFDRSLFQVHAQPYLLGINPGVYLQRKQNR